MAAALRPSNPVSWALSLGVFREQKGVSWAKAGRVGEVDRGGSWVLAAPAANLVPGVPADLVDQVGREDPQLAIRLRQHTRLGSCTGLVSGRGRSSDSDGCLTSPSLSHIQHTHTQFAALFPSRLHASDRMAAMKAGEKVSIFPTSSTTSRSADRSRRRRGKARRWRGAYRIT